MCFTQRERAIPAPRTSLARSNFWAARTHRKVDSLGPHRYRRSYAFANECDLKPRIGSYDPCEVAKWTRQRRQFFAREPAQHGKRAVVSNEPVPRENPAPEHDAPVSHPMPSDIENNHSFPGNSRHFLDQTYERLACEVVGELHGRHDIDASVRKRETQGIAANGKQ